MINLIPPDAEQAVRKEYWIRVASVWLFLTAAAFCILTILHIPSYFLLSSQLRAYDGRFEQAQAQTSESTQAETAFKNSNAVADLLSKEHNQVLFSTALAALEGLAPAGVTVTSYTFSRKGDGLGSITISGNATDRLSLASFRNAIESHSLFKVASLPLSNLTRDKDIPFTITITPRGSSDD